jgi:D-alanyl-D-alanine carboxypeptidase/D-alanyl-D-alanine-endopeptidase (penicillin-binding protein 4)
MIRGSDNLTAEMLTREIGLQVAGEATTAAGTQAIITKLGELEVPTEGVALVDGSGLDRADRVPCTTLIGALDVDDRPELQAVWAGLPVAGGDSGTLSKRLGGTPLEGNLRAKTGSLNGVTGLTGIVDMGGRPVRFAFLANDSFSEGEGVSLREEAATIISRFPEAPPDDALVPAPAG